MVHSFRDIRALTVDERTCCFGMSLSLSHDSGQNYHEPLAGSALLLDLVLSRPVLNLVRSILLDRIAATPALAAFTAAFQRKNHFFPRRALSAIFVPLAYVRSSVFFHLCADSGR